MLRRWLVFCATLVVLSWGCKGPSEEPKGAPEKVGKAVPSAPAEQPQVAEEDEDYEELDVWIEAEPDEGPPPLRVNFTCEVDSDEEGGGPFRYKWDFGDGSASEAPNPVHTYTKVGEYTVTLEVKDDKGNDGSDEIDVWVEEEEQ